MSVRFSEYWQYGSDETKDEAENASISEDFHQLKVLEFIIMTPEDCAKSGTEDAEQTALFCWAAARIAEGEQRLRWMFAIPNGGSRGGTKSQAMAVGAKLKATGVKAGVSDVFLPVPAHGVAGLFIEMKKAPEFGGKPKDASALQIEFGQAMLENGFGFCVCCGWKEATVVISQYLELE